MPSARLICVALLAAVVIGVVTHQLINNSSDDNSSDAVEMISKAERARLVKDLKEATASIERGRAKRAAAAKARALKKHGHSDTGASQSAKQADNQEMVSAEALEKALEPVAREMNMRLDNSPTAATTTAKKVTKKAAAKQVVHPHVIASVAAASAPAPAPTLLRKRKHAAASPAPKAIAHHAEKKQVKKQGKAAATKQSGGKYSAEAMMEAMRLESGLDSHHRRALAKHNAKRAAELKASKHVKKTDYVDPRKLSEELSKVADKWAKKGSKSVARLDDDDDVMRSKMLDRKKTAAKAKIAGKKFVEAGKGTTKLSGSSSLESDLQAAADTIADLKPPPVDRDAVAIRHSARTHRIVKKSNAAVKGSQGDIIAVGGVRLPTSLKDIMEPPVLQRMRAKNHGRLRLPSFKHQNNKMPVLPSFSVRKLEGQLHHSAGNRVDVKKMEGELSNEGERALKHVVRQERRGQGVGLVAGSPKEKQLAAEISSAVLAHLKGIVTKEVDKDLLHNKAA